MRLEVNIPIGGTLVADDECGTGELLRLLFDVLEAVDGRRLAEAGDAVELRDSNDQVAGSARMVPDWAVGEEVWVTTTEGSLLKSTVAGVSPADHGGYRTVVTRFLASNELLSPVLVDAHGHDQLGRPVLARVP